MVKTVKLLPKWLNTDHYSPPDTNHLLPCNYFGVDHPVALAWSAVGVRHFLCLDIF